MGERLEVVGRLQDGYLGLGATHLSFTDYTSICVDRLSCWTRAQILRKQKKS